MGDWGNVDNRIEGIEEVRAGFAKLGTLKFVQITMHEAVFQHFLLSIANNFNTWIADFFFCQSWVWPSPPIFSGIPPRDVFRRNNVCRLRLLLLSSPFLFSLF